MRLVWQAEDGSTFKTEEKCNKHEDKCFNVNALDNFLEDHSLQDGESFLLVLEGMMESNKQHLLLNYINTWSSKR